MREFPSAGWQTEEGGSISILGKIGFAKGGGECKADGSSPAFPAMQFCFFIS
jgi:hypothetical protein